MASQARPVPMHNLRVSVTWNDEVLGDTYKLLLKSQEWVENNDCMQLLKAAVAAAPDGAAILPTLEDACKVEEISLKVLLQRDSMHVSHGESRSKKQRLRTGTMECTNVLLHPVEYCISLSIDTFIIFKVLIKEPA
eukprot:jgi/Tetstr1/425127/TSEL_015589.t1